MKKWVTLDSVTPDARIGRLWFGLKLALALGLLFLAVASVQSVATLLYKMRGDVMKAATGDIWSGQVGLQVGYFVAAQLVLHLAFGVVVWVLAWATSIVRRTHERFSMTVLLWFCLLALSAIAYNAVWFPRTGLGAYYHYAFATTLGPVSIGEGIYLLVTAVAVLTMLRAAWIIVASWGISRLRIPVGVGAGAVGIIVLVMFVSEHRSNANASAAHGRPNIILLGVDSLRLDQLERFGGSGVTEHLDRFLAQADIVRDTTTPVARTFPSWAAILTGRSPKQTGARFNLPPRTDVKTTPTLGDVLREAGYHTIYSTDEVRFANIDESYGFDQVVTPPIGAVDFVIGTYNELPLASVVVNSRLGRWLFPFSNANRGAATLFQPETYLARLEREVNFDDGPTLFISHLTASHWPYYVSDTPFDVGEKKHANDRPIYRIGVQTADGMFGEIVAMLERKGALENAIVVVLSDHGEALGLPDDVILGKSSKIEGLKAPIIMLDYGHGQSVLSRPQYQVLLGIRTFGRSTGFQAKGRDLPGAATVEDIAPTLLDLINVSPKTLSATGESFAPLLRGEPGVTRVGSAERVRFTETDLRVLPGTKGGVDEVATAKQNSKLFEVNKESGRLNMRRTVTPLVIAFKERAAFTDRLLLAVQPAGPEAHQYLLIDRSTGNGKILLSPPDPALVEERLLWDAMVAEFPGELKPAVTITRQDWPVFAKQWQGFFADRSSAETPRPTPN